LNSRLGRGGNWTGAGWIGTRSGDVSEARATWGGVVCKVVSKFAGGNSGEGCLEFMDRTRSDGLGKLCDPVSCTDLVGVAEFLGDRAGVGFVRGGELQKGCNFRLRGT